MEEELVMNNLNEYIQQVFQLKQSQQPSGEGVEGNQRSCNCKQSKCLKLYCECFAEGIHCNKSCNCNDCCNNQFQEFQRKLAIANTLERNPNAFQSKFQPKRQAQPPKESGQPPRIKHSKGCACRKSNCLKKYCECYQANVVCSDLCKCTDCHNHNEGHFAYKHTNNQTHFQQSYDNLSNNYQQLDDLLKQKDKKLVDQQLVQELLDKFEEVINKTDSQILQEKLREKGIQEEGKEQQQEMEQEQQEVQQKQQQQFQQKEMDQEELQQKQENQLNEQEMQLDEQGKEIDNQLPSEEIKNYKEGLILDYFIQSLNHINSQL